MLRSFYKFAQLNYGLMALFSRFEEYKILLFRIFIVYIFYFFAKVIFTIYNYDLLGAPDIAEFFRLVYHGLTFDTSAILYVNLLFILLSIFPLYVNTKFKFQKAQFYIYFIFNLIAYATNFIDFIYFKYTYTRSTISALESISNEQNKTILFFNFLINYWHVFLLFILLSWLWIYAYKKVSIVEKKPKKLVSYFSYSIIYFLIAATLIIGGIRGGDFKKSTRPVTMVDANIYVKTSIQAAIVLNTPFAIIRTINQQSIKKVNYLPNELLADLVNPFKQNEPKEKTKPNVVIIILESFGREYLGAFNKKLGIENYKGYTPFIDSLAQHSLIFPNAYANGYKSIHGMASVLSGIPSFKDAFTSTSFSNQKIESLVSILEEEGYSTSFFHGAENGSMGFNGYANILGIDRYYGRNDYNNDDDFDGFWGIWDEPFLQYMKTKLDMEPQPFMSTVFTVSSHEPYNIPEKFKNKFPKGNIPMHKCIGYSDYALKRFFEAAKKEAWFQNTIFVMVADHSNSIYYPEYHKELNLNTVPILFYSPNEKYTGVDYNLAQQIDIYPTILDMIGYDKPFRSWGRSLINDKEAPFVIKYSNVYFYYYENYVYCFDGEKTTGFYELSDKALQHNLKDENREMMFLMEKKCKAFIQDYMNRIVDNKLANHKN